MGEQIKQIIAALVGSENAMTLQDFVKSTGLKVEAVSQGLDLLVGLRIFALDNSFVNHEIGEVVYMFADNENAQTIYKSFNNRTEE